jgi:hypothetical protein
VECEQLHHLTEHNDKGILGPIHDTFQARTGSGIYNQVSVDREMTCAVYF